MWRLDALRVDADFRRSGAGTVLLCWEGSDEVTITGSDGVGDGLLLERDDALEAVLGALEAVREGSGAGLYVVARAGLGKTSVLDVARHAGARAGLRVTSAIGSAMEVGLPFGLIDQALVGLGGSGVVDALLSGQAPGDSVARLYRTFRWLSERAVREPLLMVLDDLHWSDPDSLALLGFVCRRLAACRLVVLGALRPEPDPAQALVNELVAKVHASVVALGALSPEGSVAVLENALPGLDRAARDRVVSGCAGTPLLLKAAAAALAAGGSLPSLSVDGAFGSALLLERFSGAGADAFAYVRAASVLGVRFSPSYAGALSGLSQDVWQAAHARLMRAGLLQEQGSRSARFVHPLFARALLESQSASERERAHAAAFRLLVAQGEPDAIAAEHAHAALLIGDPLAVEITARAGRVALAQGALDAACAHLAHAVELAGDGASAELLLDDASALAARAQIDDAGRVCERLLERSDVSHAVRAHALALLARTTVLASRPADAEQLYEHAAREAALVDPATEAAVLADAASNCFMVSPLPWTLDVISRALSLLPDDDSRREPLEFTSAFIKLMGGDPAGEEPVLLTARRLLDRHDERDDGFWWTTVNAMGALKLLEDLDAVTRLFERAFDHATKGDAPILIEALSVAYSETVARLGRMREALELLERSVELSDQPVLPWTEIAFAVVLSELDRENEAEPHVAALRSVCTNAPASYNAAIALWLCVLDARRFLADGEPDRASTTMLRAAEIARLTGWRHPLIVPWAGLGIGAHISAGRIDRAKDLIADLEQVSEPLRCRWPRAVAMLGRAQLAAIEARHDDADELFDQALSAFAELPFALDHAEALIAYGSHLRRTGRPRDAREPLARALEITERAGAQRVARLAQAELAASGGRRRRRGEDPRELTAQEHRVAALAANGMTNAQIAGALHLSPKTVGHHLEHIYAKLGISSRRELLRQRDDHVQL